MNVKLNDNVVVIAGKDKGKTGRVVNTDPKAGRVTVQGVNLQKKHQKARKASDVSQIIEREGFIDASNVMVICDKCGKATRVKHAFVEVDGKTKRSASASAAPCSTRLIKSPRRQQPPRRRPLPKSARESAPPKQRPRQKRRRTEAR